MSIGVEDNFHYKRRCTATTGTQLVFLCFPMVEKSGVCPTGGRRFPKRVDISRGASFIAYNGVEQTSIRSGTRVAAVADRRQRRSI